ncbi:pab-dependent poly(a)-specific ribonuclease subunit pan2 [Acrodontium crateriforme]|uniref:PAN2-PAN3 deadenylation complex catalytic subunit PAN2 n=1 Tax=Acrodontium crateriforme TaxID=150365 RepID=A0AAQ3R5N9_9PEZI|nr:pab-dependent poly(a)-specific ribonuclease subunit pan2 [Acrodontium crateriforme]
MEADWNEITRIPFPGPSPNAPSSPVTAFAFDTTQELLWTGNEHGRVTSFYGPELQKYTSYRGHVSTAPKGAPANAPVKQLLLCDSGVLSVSSRSVHLASRKGLTQWHITQPDMVDLRCMSFMGRGTDEVVVAGCQRQMYRIDVEKGTVIETLTPPVPVPYTMMRRTSQIICAAAHDGSIYLLDPKTLAVVHSWKAYAGTVNDMDARGDYLLTCGWAQQQYQGLGLERLVRVYDIKNQRPAAPIAFPSGAAFVRMHPKLSSTCIVLSQTGVLHSIDVQNPDMPTMRFAQTFEATMSGLELMPSGKGFAMTDSHCQIIIWGSPTKMQFTEYSTSTDFGDPQVPAKPIEWTSDIPLSLVGMPFYREALLSGWSNSLVHEVGAPPERLDPSVVATMRASEYGFHGPNSRKTRRYEAEDTRAKHSAHDGLAAPKFLSEKKPRDENGVPDGARRLSEDITHTLNDLALNGNSKADKLYYYRPPEIKYSKFGVDDFDFRYFNKTKYSGLETHIVNSYANPLLQVFRFTNVARNFALHHTARDCRNENCLLCELGFLIDMLEKAQGQNCQATNFLKALSRQPGSTTLAILEEHTINTPLTIMIQNLNRFLLNRLDDSHRRVGGNPAESHLAFATIGNAYSQCTHCAYEAGGEQIWYSHDLIYPPKPTKHSPRYLQPPFAKLLKDSIERQDQQRGWCMRCQGYKAIRSRRAIRTTPAVLTVNTAIHTQEARQLWGTPNFLPREIGVILMNGQVYCYEGHDLQHHLQRRTYEMTVYELVGFVADVAAGDEQKSHLVAVVDAAISDPDPTQTGDWHLVNDFLVRPISSEEALLFDSRWKLPSVITYQAKSMSHHIDDTWKTAIDTSILQRSVSQPAFTPDYKCRPLSDEEPLPGEETHCAIDAEFVRLLREEIDIGADGSRKITRPARSGLARVSVLRGDGPEEELPFIDDYIAIDEPVDDYLTQFSGLNPGDLTTGTSRFTLVGLKEVYKKIWVLLNLGCKFIGHGLSSDFRTINIHVPEAQVIDTQDLFSLKRYGSQRKLSLRFLAWLLLQEDIQQNTITGHDSIEDARTALKLWRKYLEYESTGRMDMIGDEIWYTGKAMDFRVPMDSGRSRQPETPTASLPGTPIRQPANVARANTPHVLSMGAR